jgi:hypothetical protein
MNIFLKDMCCTWYTVVGFYSKIKVETKFNVPEEYSDSQIGLCSSSISYSAPKEVGRTWTNL